MNLFRNIKATIFGTDYIILHLASGIFVVIPVFWIGVKPCIHVDARFVSGEAFIQLPASGSFTLKEEPYQGCTPEYPFGYTHWEPITPKIKAYYKPEVKIKETATPVSTSDSTKNKPNSSLF